MKEDIFILIFGHGRSGTSLCSSLINQSPNFNVAYELWNNHIVGRKYSEMLGKKNVPKLSYEFNGNKVVIHWNLSYDNIMKCFEDKNFIFHDRLDNLKVIFTKRDCVDTIISQKRRLFAKRRVERSVNDFVTKYIVSDKVYKRLKQYFREYHVFDFDKAVECELHRKWLFDFIGEEYFSLYSDTYRGKKNYVYGSISSRNILFGKKEEKELRGEIEKEFSSLRYWPWQSMEI